MSGILSPVFPQHTASFLEIEPIWLISNCHPPEKIWAIQVVPVFPSRMRSSLYTWIIKSGHTYTNHLVRKVSTISYLRHDDVSDHPARLLALVDVNEEGIKEFIAIIIIIDITPGEFPTLNKKRPLRPLRVIWYDRLIHDPLWGGRGESNPKP